MAEKIINNPSLLPSDLAFELSGNTITAISGHPIAGSGGGTQSNYVYYPDFDETTGNIEFKLGTIYDPPSPIGGWHISGADGATGPQGEPGVNGKTPTFQINSENAHWEWKYTDDEYWTDTHVVASGAVGPKGDKGDDGISPTVSTSAIEGGSRVTFTYGEESSTYIDVMNGTPGIKGADGVSPTVSTETIAGGNRVTFTYDTPSKTKYIDVMSGAPGAPGAEGFSPTVSTTPITDDPDHPQGGTKVTVTDSTGSEEFNIWNGANGEGATVNLKDGDGIHITQSSNDYTIGVSANYSAMAVTWVQDQHYLKSVPDTYALKTDVDAASANALSEAESWVNLQNFATTTDIADMATKTWVEDQGFLKNTDLTDYATKTYANEASANALSQAETWVETEGYLKAVPAGYATETYANNASANAYNEAIARIPTDYITKDVDNLTYYYKKTETYSTTEITNALSTKLDSTVAEQTYQTKAGMTNYATKSDITDMATQTWVNQQNFATSAGLAANTRYEMTNTGWISAIKIQVDTQVPTTDDGILHIILES